MDLFLTKPVTLPPLTAALKQAFTATLKRRAQFQVEAFALSSHHSAHASHASSFPHHHHHHSRQSSTASSSFPSSEPCTPEQGHLSRSQSQVSAPLMHQVGAGTVLFPVLTSPHGEGDVDPAMMSQAVMGRVASAPSCSMAGHTLSATSSFSAGATAPELCEE